MDTVSGSLQLFIDYKFSKISYNYASLLKAGKQILSRRCLREFILFLLLLESFQV